MTVKRGQLDDNADTFKGSFSAAPLGFSIAI